jgi:YD repeat-containing protein
MNYSSGQGNGLLGMGWSIAGLSALSRCARTYAQDGEANHVLRSSVDGLCLDGNRLRLTSGTYGVASSTYQTEFETFSRVTAHGSAGVGPAYFIVEAKNGRIYEYGNTADSRIEIVGGSGTPRTWLLNKIRDRAGNAIEFVYAEDTANGSYQPTEINYGGNSGLGTSHPYRVRFVYETAQRPDPLATYFAGDSAVAGQVIEVRRMDRIDVEYNSALVRRYELTYESVGGMGSRSRLSSVQECAAAGDCFAASTFTWRNGTPGLSSSTNTGQTARGLVIDMNGDGFDDAVWVTTSSEIYYMLGSTSGYSSAINSGRTVNGVSGGPFLPLEWDGDGRMDLLATGPGNTWWVYRANGNGFDAPLDTSAAYVGPATAHVVADVDGDGRGDLVRADRPASAAHSLKVRLRSGASFGGELTAWTANPDLYELDASFPVNRSAFYNASSIRQPDFDGDGRGDVFVRLVRKGNPETGAPAQRQQVMFLSSGPVAAPTFVNGGGTPLSTVSSFQPFIGDFNGDGLQDIIYQIGTNGWRLRFNRGRGVGSEVSGPSNTGYGDQTAALVLDWDGDGMDDLLLPRISPFNWYVARSTGQGLQAPIDTGIPVNPGSLPGSIGISRVGDFNGDGLYEIGAVNTSDIWEIRLHNGVYADLLQNVTDGFGSSVTFSYVPITHNNYTKHFDAALPEQDYQGPRYVVSQYVATDGIGGTYTMSYWYYGARKHLQGRGFEGFQSRRTHDSRNGLYAYEYFNRTFPYTGTVFQRDLYQANGTTLIERTANTWTAHGYGSGFQMRYLPFANQSTTTRYEVGGVYNGQLIRTTVTNVTLDTFGNATNVASTVTDNDSSSPYAGQQWTTTTATTITPDTGANWCLSLPTHTTMTNTAPNVPTLTRNTASTPDYSNCRLSQVIAEPSSGTYKVTRDLSYDSFGNLSGESVTGIGMAARTTIINWGTSGQFPTSITNPLNQITQMGYNASLGVLTSQTDPNNLVVSWGYDGFGRKTSEMRPDGTATTWSYNNCSSNGCVSSNNRMTIVESVLNADASVQSDKNVYLDQFDRTLVTSQRMLSGAYDRNEVRYDAFGRVSQQSVPCTWSGCSAYWTTYSYDAINRLIQEQRPINAASGTLQTTTYQYLGRTTVVTDPQGKTTTKITTVAGSLGRSQDHNGYYQNFTYDAFGSLLSVSDSALNSLFSSTYDYGIDAFQRASTEMNLGARSFAYNALGERTSWSDAKGQNFSATYDALSRALTRTEAEGTTTWTWGNSAGGYNIGKLQSVSSPGYSEAYTYDTKGRLSHKQIVTDATYAYDYAYHTTTGLLNSRSRVG